GSFFSDSGDAAVAGVCRDHEGKLIAGFARSVKADSAIQAEAIAVVETLKWLLKNSSAVSDEVCWEIQTDQLELVQVIRTFTDQQREATYASWEEVFEGRIR
ncbi:hypothetical protein ACJRO7_015456, partial [Eucalyptus globulus]